MEEEEEEEEEEEDEEEEEEEEEDPPFCSLLLLSLFFSEEDEEEEEDMSSFRLLFVRCFVACVLFPFLLLSFLAAFVSLLFFSKSHVSSLSASSCSYNTFFPCKNKTKK